MNERLSGSQADAEQQARQQAGKAARQAAQAQAQQNAKGRQAEAARQHKDAAAQQANQSVHENFRKLASALHPEREPDPAERTRKTQLVQQANQANERNDLLTLLSMQLDLEQIDSQYLAGLSDARLPPCCSAICWASRATPRAARSGHAAPRHRPDRRCG